MMEAAGYDVVLVETVGVGQSEYVVADMVDTFLFLTLARTGDSLQGMKRGILELADVIAVNKADGPHEDESERAARELSGALRLLRGPRGRVAAAGRHLQRAENDGLDRVWKHVQRHRAWLDADGGLDAKRRRPAGRVDAGNGPRPAARPASTQPAVRAAVARAEAAVLAASSRPTRRPRRFWPRCD